MMNDKIKSKREQVRVLMDDLPMIGYGKGWGWMKLHLALDMTLARSRGEEDSLWYRTLWAGVQACSREDIIGIKAIVNSLEMLAR